MASAQNEQPQTVSNLRSETVEFNTVIATNNEPINIFQNIARLKKNNEVETQFRILNLV